MGRLRRYLPWGGLVVVGLLVAQLVGSTLAGADDGAAGGAEPAAASAVAAKAGAGPWEHRGGLRRLARSRVVHGEVTVRVEDGFEQRVFARGDVSAVTGTSVSVRSADGVVTVFTLNGDTRFRRLPRADAGREDVKVGAHVLVSGPRQGSGILARRVVLLG
ncbi:MAG TPA: hypothetical protein VKG45_10795 [Actinomycetes bacterium]|nr:hypothetical protein [Actinomycetes bacterium]